MDSAAGTKGAACLGTKASAFLDITMTFIPCCSQERSKAPFPILSWLATAFVMRRCSSAALTLTWKRRIRVALSWPQMKGCLGICAETMSVCRRKDVMLQEQGYLVLRFLAEDLAKNLDHVLDGILRTFPHREVWLRECGDVTRGSVGVSGSLAKTGGVYPTLYSRIASGLNSRPMPGSEGARAIPDSTLRGFTRRSSSQGKYSMKIPLRAEVTR